MQIALYVACTRARDHLLVTGVGFVVARAVKYVQEVHDLIIEEVEQDVVREPGEHPPPKAAESGIATLVWSAQRGELSDQREGCLDRVDEAKCSGGVVLRDVFDMREQLPLGAGAAPKRVRHRRFGFGTVLLACCLSFS
jgi:hypothetical protein